MKTEKELVEEGNALAREFYRCMGYARPEGYRFDKAIHPQEVLCWNMACLAYDHIESTDLQSAADEEA